MTAHPTKPPKLWWFNPQCEAENAARVAGYHTASATTRTLAADLDLLPLFLADSDDSVWVSRSPAGPFVSSLRRRGFNAERFVSDPLADPARHRWVPTPWGWSPDAAAYAERLTGSATASPREAPTPWPAQRRECFAKTTWPPLLAAIVAEMPAGFAPSKDDVGKVCGSLDAVHAAVTTLNTRGVAQAVIKAPFGTAGRGAKRVIENKWLPGVSGWVQRTLAVQGGVLVEPWRDRRVDLSVLATVNDSGQSTVLGVTRFVTDNRGQYLGTWLHEADRDALTPYLPTMRATAARVGEALAKRGHTGPYGVDAIVYRDPADGRDTGLRLKPLVEVNPRYTMGHVALALAAAIPPGVPSMWRLFGPADLRQSGGPSQLANRLASTVSWCTNDPDVAKCALGMVIEGAAARGLDVGTVGT